ncbi:phosphatase PAP2 family protein [Caldibacillus lycopersici]|uniref:Phosphatase PAP2 family protein n=1 Tax=Perspicuibacillus lycopersici TaxID=1325689 RepID=A0AAE3IZ51_9BACI|nr:phosphatase PAP2 family protein [Perspicuibacillus lycopersici]MCU9614730.1 phosphatase PAP2 family protein [Perspicuibacillus lycopersici]
MLVIKYMSYLYQLECQIFRKINHHLNRRYLIHYFHTITHLGGATFTIAASVLLLFLSTGLVKLTALASVLSLIISHIPVAIVKKIFPRKRPYLVLDEIHVTENPLQDHSFPSGHTTAIFAILIPFILFIPLNSISLFMVFIGVSVALSRIVLGLHYPSDVLVGCLLGTFSGYFSYYLVMNLPLLTLKELLGIAI